MLMITDPVVTGGVVALALAAIKLAEVAVSKLSAKKNGASFEGRMLNFRAKMLDTHVGPGAIDAKTGTPRWWGVEGVNILREIRDEMKEGSSAAIKRDILDYLRESDDCRERIEAQRQGALEAQTEILAGIADGIGNCEFCQDSIRRTKASG